MNVLLIGQYYPPVKGAGSRRAKRFADFLVEAGHKVTVLSGFPTYPTGVLEEKYHWKLWAWEKDGKIKILRVYEFPAPIDNTLKRMLNLASFTITSWFAAVILPIFDLVIVTSPPFLAGLAGIVAKRDTKTKFIFDIRDLWPDVTIDLNLLKPGILFDLLKKLEKTFYRKADHILTATERIRRKLILQGVRGEKVTTIYNSADINLFKPRKKVSSDRKDSFKLIYVGNHSRVYNLENVLEAAKLLVENRKIEFIFVGEGESKNGLLELKNKLALSNVTFLPEKTPQEVAELINSSDCGLISLDDKLTFQETVPAKTAEYLACGKPIIATIGGEVKRFIEENNAGLICEPKNPELLSQTILKLYKNKKMRQKMGINARNLALKTFSNSSAKKSLAKIISLIGLA